MKYYLSRKLGCTIDSEPDNPDSNPNGGSGGGAGNPPSSQVRDPEKLLERYEASKTELKTVKTQLKELAEWKAAQEKAASEKDEEILRQSNDWKSLLDRKEKEYQDSLISAKSKFDEDLTKYQGYENELQAAKATLEQYQSETTREKAFNRFLKGLWKDFDNDADLDYFEFKFASRITFDKDSKPLLDGQILDLEAFKKSSDTQIFWRKETPTGNGSEPGLNNKTFTPGKSESGTYELPRSIYSNPSELAKWITAKGFDGKTFNDSLMKNLIKIVD